MANSVSRDPTAVATPMSRSIFRLEELPAVATTAAPTALLT